MVKMEVTNNPYVHDDNTVEQTTIFTCESKEEFVRMWDNRKYAPKSREIKWNGNIDTLIITAKEWIDFKKVLFPEEVEEYVLTADDRRMVKIHQIEEWMKANPQFHETENWPIVEYCVERMYVVDSGELFDYILQLFIINTRDYNPACFYRGDEEE